MTKSKSPQRLLQKRTGWSYSECLRCVRTMTPEAIEALTKLRGGYDEQGRLVAGEDGS